MTLQDLPSLLAYPGMRSAGGINALAASSQLLDAAGEYVASVVTPTKAGNIAAVGWLPSTVTGSGKVEVRAETVGSDGLPTGTLWATNTNIAAVAPASNTWRWDTLTAAAAVSVGDLIAFKIIYESGTSVRVSVYSSASVQAFQYNGVPYQATNTGSPAKSGDTVPIIALRYDDNSVEYFGTFPTNSTTLAVSIDETSTPDEVGAKIVLPMKCKVAGVGVNPGTAGRLIDVKLYDALDNVLASKTGIDTDQFGNLNGQGMILFATPVALDPGTYRCTVSPKSGGSSISMRKILFDAAGTRSAWPGGRDMQWTQRTDAGAWTDTNTALPIIDLLISQLDDGAGAGGGLLVNPGLNGGML